MAADRDHADAETGVLKTAQPCEWCGRAIYRGEKCWLSVKGVERGYDPVLCDESDDGFHSVATKSAYGARLHMLDQITDERFRVGCATPGLHCQEFPLFAPTLDAARGIAKEHAEEQQHVSSIRWVRTTSIEEWAPTANPDSGV